MINGNVHDLTNKHKRYIYLDDFREPKDSAYYLDNPIYVNLEWIIVRSYDEFVNDTLTNGLGDGYSFDHDLADTHYAHQNNIDYDVFSEKTGFDCAKWLINYCIDNQKELPTTILIHSMNPAGSLNIKSLFDSYKKSLDLPSSR